MDLVELLEATSDFQVRDESLFVFDILALFGQESSRELISVDFQEEVFVNQVCEYCNDVINELVDVFRSASLSKKFINVA